MFMRKMFTHVEKSRKWKSPRRKEYEEKKIEIRNGNGDRYDKR